ncbi:hypothetical protein FISHEDRAFT_74564 [Fistulina hepatica ATCC 64428]|uniref:CCHC-type domain-containing protein n=1 Tax=Fistulina hepatica ATCC 64428 TaxID=1128425 RepID=A0A0D7AAM2_9AGAR|nr:hypothetical protein FISHEDRAFT_74564 [Fistulina hepatica ATCC 64428]
MCNPFQMLHDFQVFKRLFTVLYNYLLGQNKISDTEASHMLFATLDVRIINAVVSCLAIVKPDHFPSDPYLLEDLQNTIEWVLTGTAMNLTLVAPATVLTLNFMSMLPYAQCTVPPLPIEPKHEDLSEALKRALVQYAARQAPTNDLAHSLPLLLAMLQAHAMQPMPIPGLTNAQALIASLLGAAQAPQVPMTNSYILHQAVGRPNQPPGHNGNCNYCGGYGHYINECPEVEADIHADRQPNPAVDAVPLQAQGFILAVKPDDVCDATIAGCEEDDQSFQAMLDKLSGVQSQNVQVKPIDNDAAEGTSNATKSPCPHPRSPAKVVKIFKCPGPKATISEPTPEMLQAEALAKTRPAKSSEPNETSTWVYLYLIMPAQPMPAAHAPAPAYHSAAPIEDDDAARTIYEAILDGKTVIKNRHLLSIVPEVRHQIRDATTTRRIVAQPIKAAQASSSTAKLPAKAVATDPIVSYYQGQLSDAPPPVIKGATSSTLHMVMPLVNSIEEVESVLDGGCQIVAMSKRCASNLGVAWNPDECINLQSANGVKDKTLGLARDVPFQFHDMTIYLQCHIIDMPAYDVLLGHPFYELTTAVTCSFMSGKESLTLKDLNNRWHLTFLTY